MTEIIKHKINSKEGLGEVAFLPEGMATVFMQAPNAAKGPAKDVFGDAVSDENTEDYACWGVDNDWPTVARQKLEDSSIAYPLIYKQVCMMFGSGIRYFKRIKEDGEEKIVFETNEKIDKFFNENDIERFALEQIMDFKFFGNAWSHFIMTRNTKEIANIYHLEAEFTRMAVQNDNTKKIDKIGYSGKWDNGTKDVQSFPLLDRREKTPEQIRANFKTKKEFAHHTFFPSPGRKYYAMPPHGALYKKDGWLDYESSIPVLLNALNRNQMIIRYHIKIPYEYWNATVKNWDTLPEPKRQEIIQAKLEEMNKWLTGINNAGKTFISHFATDPITGKELAGITIESVADKLDKNAYIPSSEVADQKISRALNVDASLASLQPEGGKMGAGSGSDKRESFNNAIDLSKAEQRILFEPFYIVRNYNGWGPDWEFGFAHKPSTTKDKEPTGKSKEEV